MCILAIRYLGLSKAVLKIKILQGAAKSIR